MKTCKACKRALPEDAYLPDKRTSDKLASTCASCQGIALPGDAEKRCLLCEIVKPLEDFNKDLQSVDLHRKICKACAGKSAARWTKDAPERFAKYGAMWRRAKRDTHRATQRKAHLKKTYNITPEQYWEMFELQGRVCAICHTAPKTKNLHVDHDHKTGAVRGLLCSSCNSRLLPIIEHHPERIDRTFEYLANPPFDRLTSNQSAEKVSAETNKEKVHMDLNTISFDTITTGDDLMSAYGKVFEGFPLDGPATDEQIAAVETALSDERWDAVTQRLIDAGVKPTEEQADTLDTWFNTLAIDHMFSGLDDSLVSDDD